MFLETLFFIYSPLIIFAATLLTIFALVVQHRLGAKASPKALKRLPRLFLLLAFIVSMHFFIGYMMVLRTDWVVIIFLMPYAAPIALYLLYDEQHKRRTDEYGYFDKK